MSDANEQINPIALQQGECMIDNITLVNQFQEAIDLTFLSPIFVFFLIFFGLIDFQLNHFCQNLKILVVFILSFAMKIINKN